MTTTTPASSPSNDPSANGETTYRYWAFLSYSHRDIAWAKKLHTRLEKWSVPRRLVGRPTPVGAIPKRLFPIFRDRDELSAGNSLDDVIRAALKQSRYLVVVCSPNSAASKYVNEEIRSFKMAGRDARVIYVIVDGDPGAGDAVDAGGCFPPAALRIVSADGTYQEGRVEPIAADVRAGKDGPRNALLKILARVLDVGFDDLKRRDLLHRRRARAIGVALALALTLLAAAGYVGLADDGVRVPGADAIRTEIDRHEASVFRPAATEEQIRHQAQIVRSKLNAGLFARRQSDGWINDAPMADPNVVQPPVISLISHSQAISAILSCPDADAGSVASTIDSLEALFRPGPNPERVFIEHAGIKWGWITDPSKTAHSQADLQFSGQINGFVPLWTAIALCESIERLDAHSDPKLRERLLIDLEATEECLRLYHPDADSGAWNAYPFQDDAKTHSVYATALAMLALNEACRAKVPWDGSTNARDQLALRTAKWLIDQHISNANQCGWVNEAAEEHASGVYDGLTAQTYAALLDAEQTVQGVVLSDAMQIDIRNYLTSCAQRSLDYPVDVGEFRLAYRHVDGQDYVDKEAMRYLWWPWVIRSAQLWLQYADQNNLPREYRVQIRRTLAHLVIDLGPAQVVGMPTNYSYMIAEDLFGLRGF